MPSSKKNRVATAPPSYSDDDSTMVPPSLENVDESSSSSTVMIGVNRLITSKPKVLEGIENSSSVVLREINSLVTAKPKPIQNFFDPIQVQRRKELMQRRIDAVFESMKEIYDLASLDDLDGELLLEQEDEDQESEENDLTVALLKRLIRSREDEELSETLKLEAKDKRKEKRRSRKLKDDIDEKLAAMHNERMKMKKNIR